MCTLRVLVGPLSTPQDCRPNWSFLAQSKDKICDCLAINVICEVGAGSKCRQDCGSSIGRRNGLIKIKYKHLQAGARQSECEEKKNVHHNGRIQQRAMRTSDLIY
ncbi:hypothetical protein ILYODFUR_030607 [Ilyodon furcidens]|uniref:Uncharacterized protein n=1 Tax=Ilyodon furcidens TaxID=33524 RepID=A0ABV0T1M4_9TELE